VHPLQAAAAVLAKCHNITYGQAMATSPSSFVNRTSLRRRLDHAGIALAGLCAAHCLATLLIVSALGLGSHFLLAESIHRTGLLLAVLVAAVAIGWGFLRHRRVAPLAIAGLGIAVMACALLVEHGSAELLLTLAGVALVSVGHVLNLRAAR
jgi:drug/metabolite transporter (DMT)-like permease